MSEHYPALLVILPLLASFFISAAGWLRPACCFPLAVAALGASLLVSLGLLSIVIGGGPVSYRLGGWAPPWGICYQVDHLNALVLAVVSVVGFINLTAARTHVKKDFPERAGPFYTLYVLFVTGLLGMVVTGDAFNLYVLLEIAAITGYALIAMGKGRAPLSSLNYIFMGTIGACFYLLGVGYLYIVTGSLNMEDIARLLPPLHGSKVVTVAFVIMMVGIWLKMGFFPLHAWLPNAYTYAPSPVSSLVAPLMTKVMVYVMIRMVVTVFTVDYAFGVLGLNEAVVWLAVIAIVAGSVLALAEKDVKRMLTFIVVAEVGYMVGGFWLGNRPGFTGAVLHIVNDALMTLCLFLAVGNIVYAKGNSRWESLPGLFRTMPWTMGALVVGALSIIGVPPTCGFFSKWYLLLGAIQGGHYGFLAALLFSSLVSVVLFFRIFEMGYFEPLGAPHGPTHGQDGTTTVREAPLGMLAPLWITALGLILVGLYTGQIVGRVIRHAVPAMMF
ncbi:MAG: monovalent cation/H+ antiporter subunit D family protein [Deltaproteobacteria bacterium]|nr:monovalent cation/H+ antiporter subunit D family protein [Deltaproteobacteria bacterium]